MSQDDITPTSIPFSPEIWAENVHFWEKAWSNLKTPYTQMPDLPYLSQIPAKLAEFGAKKVLDLGCGSGWLAVYLARQGFIVEGVDIAPQAINLARMWAEAENLPASFLVGDIIDLNLAGERFDAIVANSIFEHLTWDYAVKALAELHSLLKPQGLFFGCFDQVGTGPGKYVELADHTHIYTDKGRKGMLLRCFSDRELEQMFAAWKLISLEKIESGSRLVWAQKVT